MERGLESEPPSAEVERPSVLPALSDDVRAQVRARLEAKAKTFRPSRVDSEPPTRSTSSAPPPARRRNLSRAEHRALDVRLEKERVLRELQEEADRPRRKNYYELLGVHRHSSKIDIEHSFERASKEHHPDHVLSGAPGLAARTLAEEIHLMFERAFDALCDPASRAEYDRTLPREDSLAVASMIAAERAFDEGMEHCNAGNWPAALEAFRVAADRNPNEGAYVAHRAWARFFVSPDDHEVSIEALEDLETALTKSPRLEDAYVFRGLIYERLGDRDQAVRNLQTGGHLQPRLGPRAARVAQPPAGGAQTSEHIQNVRFALTRRLAAC